MKYDFIGIDLNLVVNLKGETHFIVLGTVLKKKVEFSLSTEKGNRKIKHKNLNDNVFLIDEVLEKNEKHIKLSINDGKQEYFICSNVNKFFRKIRESIEYRNITYALVNMFASNHDLIDYQKIGILNGFAFDNDEPKVCIIGTAINPNIEFVLYEDGEKINFDLIKVKNDFLITAKLNKSSNVILHAKMEDKEYYVCSIANNYLTRFKNNFGSLEKLKQYHNKIYSINKNIIGISTNEIFGLLHPKLIINGTFLADSYEFVLLADGEKIDYVKEVAGTNFTIKSDLKLNFKKIDLYVVLNEKKYYICSNYNTLYRRIRSKTMNVYKNSSLKPILQTIKNAIHFFWKEYHFLVPPTLWLKYIREFKESVRRKKDNLFLNPFNVVDYNKWLKLNKQETSEVELEYRPLISLLIPVYNVDGNLLDECIKSILNQTYDNYEICLVDDCSTKEETLTTLKKYENYPKIKIQYREKNGHISNATNDALKMATGEYVGLIDNDDLITKNALYEVVKVLNTNRKLDFIYSDEDKINLKGNYCDPHFKPDFSPDTLMSLNYICHFSVLRKAIVEKVGGFEVGLEGAQDHDLFLKVSEVTDQIYHIPLILYHWRMIKGSTSLTIKSKEYANDKGKIAVENALKRRNIKGYVEKDVKSTYYIVHYENENPLISIIIPTRDYADTLDTCIKSIYSKTTYKNFEIIIANNNSEKQETFDLFEEYKKNYDNLQIVDINTEFNYSYINNEAVRHSHGEYVVLLNNDTEIISPNWLEEMVGYASQKHIGTVGVKLLYPDMTVQHGGIIMGLGGVASHAYIGASRSDLGMYGRLRVPYNYIGSTAACIMISRKKYDEVNGLEEKLKVAYNDVDLNLKLINEGYYNVFLPYVELNHFESKSRGMDTTTEKYQRFLKESDFMNKKWKKYIDNDPFYNPNFSKKGWFVLDKDRKN